MNRPIFNGGCRFVALLLLTACLLSQTDAQAQSRVATSAAPFLTMGTGARGSALGQAYTAVATGADALYWNPAGAARAYEGTSRGGLFFSNTRYLVDTDYNAFGLVVPVTRAGVVGFSIAQLDHGRMDVTTVDLPDGTGETFGAGALVVGLSYAQPLTDAFYIGGTAKYVRENIYDMAASTAAFDIGFILQSEYLNGLRLGASIMNFGGRMQMSGINTQVFTDVDPTSSGSNDGIPARIDTDEWDLPLSFKFGVALPVINTAGLRLDLLSDAQQTNDNSLNADFGSELHYSLGATSLSLRVGYKDLAIQDIDSHMSYGGGLDVRLAGVRFGADFAYVPFEELGQVTMLDFRLHF